MFKSFLLIAIFSIFSVKAQVLSGHQEFVHYSSEQKENFITGVMELMIELENKYQTASVPQKAKYSILLKKLNDLIINSAHAKESIDLNIYAQDLTKLLDPNRVSPKRCIYAGWVSKTVTQGNREICQHPNFISGGVRSPETIAYKQSSDCGSKNQNTISCNPAIFGFKNKTKGSQFCVPAGPSKSENSSYACMQLAIGIKTEEGADPAPARMEQLKKNFEGNPGLVNNLYGFIYKTCICDTQENIVINEVYLSRTRPHRTCLGLVNTIAEVNHCVEFGTAKSSDMNLFKELRGFTNDIAGRASGSQVDSEYTKLLQSMKTRFSNDYAHMCGGEIPPKTDDSDKIGDGGDSPPPSKDCIGECDLVDGKFTNCSFKNGEETLEVSPPEDGSKEFSTKVGEENYLCKIQERSIDHKTSCALEIKGEGVSYKLIKPEEMSVEVKSTNWTPPQDGAVVETVSFGELSSISLSLNITVDGRDAGVIDCGSAQNPQSGKVPQIDLIPDGGDSGTQKFSTKVDPDDKGWTYEWTRVDSTPPLPKRPKANIQGDSDSDSDDGAAEEVPENGDKKLDNSGDKYSAPKEDNPYQVCVQLVKNEDPNLGSNKACKTVNKSAAEEDIPSPIRPKIGGPQIKMPQIPTRQGVDYSRGGIL